MAIKKIKVNNFTVFNELEINASDGVNVIIGENGVGKTHLLKLIYSVWLARNEILTNANKIFARKEKYRFIYQDNSNKQGNIIRELIYETIWEGFNQTYLMAKEDMSSSQNFIIMTESTTLFEPVFIPAREILSMSNITRIDDKYGNDLAIDRTFIDFIKKAQNIKPDKIPDLAINNISKIEKIINGKVFINESDLTFWIRKNNKTEIPFSMEAEGITKFGLLWQLLMNESITKGSILLWDEPDANINPRYISELVEILLDLSRNGVQLFLTTHDYYLSKYFEVLSNKNDLITFHALYKTDEGVKCESSDKMSTLVNNDIVSEIIRLYEAEIEKVTG